MRLEGNSIKHLPMTAGATGLVDETDAHLALSSVCTEAVSIGSRSMTWEHKTYRAGRVEDKERGRRLSRDSVDKETPCCDHSKQALAQQLQ